VWACMCVRARHTFVDTWRGSGGSCTVRPIICGVHRCSSRGKTGTEQTAPPATLPMFRTMQWELGRCATQKAPHCKGALQSRGLRRPWELGVTEWWVAAPLAAQGEGRKPSAVEKNARAPAAQRRAWRRRWLRRVLLTHAARRGKTAA
jgi:hypothetical protein